MSASNPVGRGAVGGGGWRPSTPEQLLMPTPQRHCNVRRHLRHGLLSLSSRKQPPSNRRQQENNARPSFQKSNAPPGANTGPSMVSKHRGLSDTIRKKMTTIVSLMQKAANSSTDLFRIPNESNEHVLVERLQDITQLVHACMYSTQAEVALMKKKLDTQADYLLLMAKKGFRGIIDDNLSQLHHVVNLQDRLIANTKILNYTLKAAVNSTHESPPMRTAVERWRLIQARLRMKLLFSDRSCISSRMNECFLQRRMAERQLNRLAQAVARVNFGAAESPPLQVTFSTRSSREFR